MSPAAYCLRVVFVAWLALVPGAGACAEGGGAARAWPLLQDNETLAEYAARAGLPATKTLDLGGGEKLELVLIPAGKFRMGVGEPEPLPFWFSLSPALTITGLLVAVFMCALVLDKAIRRRRWPQFSLRWLLGFCLAASFAAQGPGSVARARALEDSRALSRELLKITDKDTRPAHDVTISRPYYTGFEEVTQAQYAQIAGTNPSNPVALLEPVTRVTWTEAQRFCESVRAKTGQKARLPTEAEWEHSNRVAFETMITAGMTPSEWCNDWYDEGYYAVSPETDPQGPAHGTYRVARGPLELRAVFPFVRLRSHPESRHEDRSFRVVVEVGGD